MTNDYILVDKFLNCQNFSWPKEYVVNIIYQLRGSIKLLKNSVMGYGKIKIIDKINFKSSNHIRIISD